LAEIPRIASQSRAIFGLDAARYNEIRPQPTGDSQKLRGASLPGRELKALAALNPHRGRTTQPG
jgi:hypothetical protein